MSDTVPRFDADVPGVRGTLTVSRLGGGGGRSDLTRFRSVYVAGVDDARLEDNDIRGFLDGDWYLPWNQATQSHVRVGRFGYGGRGSAAPRGRPPTYGEHELFRTLHRWKGVRLPVGASLHSASLTLAVEHGHDSAVRMMLYEVKKDWGAGTGGVQRDNASVPAAGEVWWNEAALGSDPWGLPGAGFGADEPGADTGREPLAEVLYRPADEFVTFESSRLTRYVATRTAAGESLRLLIKLSDSVEDVPGVRLVFYAAEYGDSLSASRRPRLELEWEHADEVALVERDIWLEGWRSTELGPLPCTPHQPLAVSFKPKQGYEAPVVYVRPGAGQQWRRVDAAFTIDADAFEVRVAAVVNPIELGEAFEAELEETWTTRGPPEEQEVLWSFVSPSGVEHEIPGEYQGGFRWKVGFVPDELGRWSFRWSHCLDSQQTGPRGCFDVTATRIEPILERLRAIPPAVGDGAASRDPMFVERQRFVFSRLQRGAISLLDPVSYRSHMSGELRVALRKARSALWGRQMPAEIPMWSMPRHVEWEGRPVREPFPRITDPGGGSATRLYRAGKRSATRMIRRVSRPESWRKLFRRMLPDGRS